MYRLNTTLRVLYFIDNHFGIINQAVAYVTLINRIMCTYLLQLLRAYQILLCVTLWPNLILKLVRYLLVAAYKTINFRKTVCFVMQNYMFCSRYQKVEFNHIYSTLPYQKNFSWTPWNLLLSLITSRTMKKKNKNKKTKNKNKKQNKTKQNKKHYTVLFKVYRPTFAYAQT